MVEHDDLIRRYWDFIIIGTGMGGATIGYALAKAGYSVLFCEKGKSHLHSHKALRGNYAEMFFSKPQIPSPKQKDILSLAGRYWEEIIDLSYCRPRKFVPFIGSGSGGSSAIYGMAMERFFHSDFSPGRYYSNDPEANVPQQWPIAYEEMLPYYEKAEQLYRVRGGNDPLRGSETLTHLIPPPLSNGSREMDIFFKKKGINSYRLPIACDYIKSCKGCQGYLCDGNCRNDSSRICLEPALTNFDSHLLDECEVLKITATRNETTGIKCFCRGKISNLKSKFVILGAGALATPKILFESASEYWPNGLANDSGLVGRNLMRHYIDLYAVFPRSTKNLPGNNKEIAFNDLYVSDNYKLGTVQSFGAMPPAKVVVESLEQELRDGSLTWMAWLFKTAKPMVRPILNSLFSRTIILATIMEDLPYMSNRVFLSEQTNRKSHRKLTLKYRISKSEKNRIAIFRKKMREVLKPYHYLCIKQAENNERIAHVCGTCRFGTEQKTSVLDCNNKAHGLSNLYVVDSSFFPTSAGTNPALTIAANALRVADKILGEKNGN